MKKLLQLFIAALLVITACSAPKERGDYTITGNVTGLDSGMVYLQEYVDGQMQTLDSAQADAGSFVLEGNLDEPVFAYLFLGGKARAGVFIEEGEMFVSGDVTDKNSLKLKGSKSQDTYQAYLNLVAPWEETKTELIRQWRELASQNNKAKQEEIDRAYNEADSVQNALIAGFIKENAASPVAPYLVRRNLIYKLDAEELQEYIDGFDVKIDSHPYVGKLRERVVKLESVAPGKKAPDFALADTSGNQVALSDIEGDVILVDFWASWCSPCRRENPNIVKAFRKYHDKGFNILGVSLDNDRQKWIQAIYQDSLYWHHISDLKGWKNEAAQLYGVMSIPHSVLLDGDGIIIEHNLRGEALQEKLAELFKD